jgi:hypothetical protein
LCLEGVDHSLFFFIYLCTKQDVMINSVRNTVLSILNKNNYGYISPSDFNLFAKQAQLEIFEEYFSKYNDIVNMQNVRRSGSEYGDELKAIEEAMEVFSRVSHLTRSSSNNYFLPSIVTTGDDYYLLNKVSCYTDKLSTGTNTGISVNFLVDSAANFITDGIEEDDIVANDDTGGVAVVLEVSSATTLLLSDDIFQSTGEEYSIYNESTVSESEKVNHNRIDMLKQSLLTAPSNKYPIYVQNSTTLKVYPKTINSDGQVWSQYFRYPSDPKWTYITLISGEPAFDQTQPDYKDFELPMDDEYKLIAKILQYSGISIREADVYTFAKREELEQSQQSQTTK